MRQIPRMVDLRVELAELGFAAAIIEQAAQASGDSEELEAAERWADRVEAALRNDKETQ